MGSHKVPLDELIARYLQDKGYNKAYDGLLEDLNREKGFEGNARGDEHDLVKIFESIQGFMSQPEDTYVEPEFAPKHLASQVVQSFQDAKGFVVDVASVGINIVVSTADKALRVYKPDRTLVTEINQLHGNAPARAVCGFYPGSKEDMLLVSGGMDGSVIVSNLSGDILDADLRAHSRFISAIDVYGPHIVIAGFDSKIKTYFYDVAKKSLVLRATLETPKPPTCVRFIPGKTKDALPKVVFGRKESSRLFVYPVDLLESEKVEFKLWEAEFGTYIATFNPLFIAVDPVGRRIAVATDHIPYGRILVLDADTGDILSNMSSMAPQDMYSTPYLAWSQDGRGIWSAGDDGKIRGLDVATGQIVAEINAHASKVKALTVLSDGSLVSGGADKKVLLWNTVDNEKAKLKAELNAEPEAQG